MKARLLAETLGTFFIVLAPVALSAGAHLPGGDGSLLTAALVSGLSVLAMVTTLGHVSGAHFNPAVTLALALSGRFAFRHAPGYVAAQILGSVAAAGLVRFCIAPGSAGTHVPHGALLPGLVLEAVLTFFLMLVILSVATDPRSAAGSTGLAIGLVVTTDVLIGGPVSGGSMNPARSLGPALLAGGSALHMAWIYCVGPCLGAALAVPVYGQMRARPAPKRPKPEMI